MKTSKELINEFNPNAISIIKDIGNNGYYVTCLINNEKSIKYISKYSIISYLNRYETNERKKKLISIKIMSE